MSTILKALRRLEQEKAASAEGRALREEVAYGLPSEPDPARRWAPAAAALLVGLGIGAAIFAWMSSGDAPPAVASAPEPPPAPQGAAPAPPAPDVPAPALPLAPEGGVVSAEDLGALFPSLSEDAFASDVEVVRRPEALPRLVDPSPVEPAVPPKPGQRRPVEDSSAARRARRALADAAAAGAARRPAQTETQLAEPATQPLAPAREPEPAPVQEPREPAPTPIARAEPKPEPRPAPPVEERAEPEPPPKPVAKVEPAPEPAPAPAPLPSLQVEKTLWHPRPDRRRAWLRLEGEAEAQQVVEGDVIGGLLVAEIEPSGVVLERDGERIERGLGGR